MKVLGIIGGVIGAILLICLMIFLGLAMRFGNMKVEGWFQPQEQNGKHKVFKNTRAYNEAKAQDLARYKLEYTRAKDPADKEAIAGFIRSTFAEYNPDDFANAELGNFLRSIMNGTDSQPDFLNQ